MRSQQREKIKTKTCHTEILELKSKMTELKNSRESFSGKLDQAEKSVSLKTDQLKLPNQRVKKEKELKRS